MIHTLNKKKSIVNQFLAELRDENVQLNRMRFRRNMERIGEILAYEISKKLKWKKEKVITTLGVANVPVLAEQPILATILRAGLPLHQGLLNYFDNADNAFVSAYRKHARDGSFEIKLEYISTPDVKGRVLVISDPMLATGSSMVLAYKALTENGKPRHTHIVSILASSQGINYLKRNLPRNVTIWAGAVDEELTAQSYIVPGLGDAGDLAFGEKI